MRDHSREACHGFQKIAMNIKNEENQRKMVEKKSCTGKATRALLYLSLSSQCLSSVLRCNLRGCDRGRLTTQAEVASNY